MLSHYRLIYYAGLSAHSVLLPLLYGGVGRSINSAVATWSVCLVDKGRNSELGAELSSGLQQQHKEWALRSLLCVCIVCRNDLLRVLHRTEAAQAAGCRTGFCGTHGPFLKQPYFKIPSI